MAWKIILGCVASELLLIGLWHFYAPTPGTDGNDVRYFFSSSAQVWAALVAFGGFLVRDRSIRYEDKMDDYFRTSTEFLKKIETFLFKNANEGWKATIYIEREAFESYLRKQGRFSTVLEKLSKNSYSMDDYPEDIQRAANLSIHKEPNSNWVPNGKFVGDLLASAVVAYDFYLDRKIRRRRVDLVFPWIIFLGSLLVLWSLVLLSHSSTLTSPSCWFFSTLFLSIIEFWLFAYGFLDDGTRPSPKEGQ